jgi:hypothetical protein
MYAISKSKFVVEQIEYLGYWITRQGIQPIRNKVEVNIILNIKAPKTRKGLRPKQEKDYAQNKNQICQVIGIVNFIATCGFAEVSF